MEEKRLDAMRLLYATNFTDDELTLIIEQIIKIMNE